MRGILRCSSSSIRHLVGGRSVPMVSEKLAVVAGSSIRRSVVGGQQHRLFSGDSHDDFKPKRKEIPTQMEDVMKLIDSQVKENDVMLYMKGKN